MRDATDLHPGLVALPGSQFLLETAVSSHEFSPLVDGTGVAHPKRDAASFSNPGCSTRPILPRGRQPRGRFGARTFFPLTNRNELGGNSVRQGPQGRPVIGSLHHSKMEQSYAEVVAPEYANRRR